MTTTYRTGFITKNQRPYAALAKRLKDAEAKRRTVEAASPLFLERPPAGTGTIPRSARRSDSPTLPRSADLRRD